MKLKAYTAKSDEGTASYAVDWMGKTYPVNPGQKEIAIEGVTFSIEGADAEPEQKAPAETERKSKKK